MTNKLKEQKGKLYDEIEQAILIFESNACIKVDSVIIDGTKWGYSPKNKTNEHLLSIKIYYSNNFNT